MGHTYFPHQYRMKLDVGGQLRPQMYCFCHANSSKLCPLHPTKAILLLSSANLWSKENFQFINHWSVIDFSGWEWALVIFCYCWWSMQLKHGKQIYNNNNMKSAYALSFEQVLKMHREHRNCGCCLAVQPVFPLMVWQRRLYSSTCGQHLRNSTTNLWECEWLYCGCDWWHLEDGRMNCKH